MLHFKPLTLHI